MKAILLLSHGSRSPKAKKEVKHLAKKLKRLSGAAIFESAFLDVNRPSIPEGIRRCVQKGAREIIVLLNFLNSGDHAIKDIPLLIRKSKAKYSSLSFLMTKPIGIHPKIPQLFMDTLRGRLFLKK